MGWRDFFRSRLRRGDAQVDGVRARASGPLHGPPMGAEVPFEHQGAAGRRSFPEAESGLFDRFSPDALRRMLRLRLVNLDDLTTVEGLPHLRALAPGVVEVVALDLPNAVVHPPATDLARLATPSQLVATGRDNLRRLLDSHLSSRTVQADDGLRFDFVYGDDYFIGSLATTLPALLDYVAPGTPTAKGVFVTIPDCHHLAYRVVEDVSSLLAVGPMASFGRHGYDDGIGPISPHTYWAKGPRLDVWDQLTVQLPTGVEIHVPPELTALVAEA